MKTCLFSEKTIQWTVHLYECSVKTRFGELLFQWIAASVKTHLTIFLYKFLCMCFNKSQSLLHLKENTISQNTSTGITTGTSISTDIITVSSSVTVTSMIDKKWEDKKTFRAVANQYPDAADDFPDSPQLQLQVK